MMKSPNDEDIIQRIIDTTTDDDHDLDNNYVLLNISPKKACQAIVILNNYFLQR